nr:mat [Madagascaria erythrocladioides]
MVNNLMWNKICWPKVIANVEKNQKAIYIASAKGDIQLLRLHQQTLLNSKQAKLFAVYKAIQLKTANIKPQNTRKINFETSTFDNLLLLVLQPEWEAKTQSNCYGFKRGYDINQALLKTYATLSHDVSYENAVILSGQINNILDNLDPLIITQKSGYKGFFKKYLVNRLNDVNLSDSANLVNPKFQFDSIITISKHNIGFIFSAILIHGFEDSLIWFLIQKQKLYINEQIHANFRAKVISYANHFIIIFSFNDVENIIAAIRFLDIFLLSIKSKFNTNLIQVRSIYEGFDFLGFNFQRLKNYKNWNHENTKLFIKPTKKNIKKHLLSIRKCLYHKDRLNRWRANSSMKQYQVITKLNPLINSFANYYHCLTPLFILKRIDRTINEMIYRYAIKKYKSGRYDKWKKNWTQVINGKRVIAYYDEMTQQFKPLNLHYSYKKDKLRKLDQYYFY